MKNLINKFINSMHNSLKYVAFLTIDHSNITVSLYKKSKNQYITQLIAENTCEIKGFSKNILKSPTLVAHSIAKCIDGVEEKSNFRIKNIILNLIGFNSKQFIYPLILNKGEELNPDNLLKHVNISEIKYYLDEDYILTNLIPLELLYKENIIDKLNFYSKIAENIKINLLVAGFKKHFICELLEIFYNLSLNVDHILYAGVVVPLIFNNNTSPILLIGGDYTLLYNTNNITFLTKGTNTIFDNISNKTNIPYRILQKNGYLIKDVLIGESCAPLYRVEDFFIENVKNVVEQSIDEYVQEIIHLITSNKLINHDKIIIINNNLKWLKEQGLLSSLNLLNVTFNTETNNKYLNYKLNNTQIINKALVAYYNKNICKDFALLTFKQDISQITNEYMTIKE